MSSLCTSMPTQPLLPYPWKKQKKISKPQQFVNRHDRHFSMVHLLSPSHLHVCQHQTSSGFSQYTKFMCLYPGLAMSFCLLKKKKNILGLFVYIDVSVLTGSSVHVYMYIGFNCLGFWFICLYKGFDCWGFWFIYLCTASQVLTAYISGLSVCVQV